MLFEDAPHASGKFIFNDYYQQFVETLKFAYKSDFLAICGFLKAILVQDFMVKKKFLAI